MKTSRVIAGSDSSLAAIRTKTARDGASNLKMGNLTKRMRSRGPSFTADCWQNEQLIKEDAVMPGSIRGRSQSSNGYERTVGADENLRAVQECQEQKEGAELAEHVFRDLT